jgi:hypothetical protein
MVKVRMRYRDIMDLAQFAVFHQRILCFFAKLDSAIKH